ncbi:hypothetical protein CRG98_040989 [Punica granatum]|uniref:Uncharacterized protein n=1 Tax=Punica granatum TaxID=22663 RepID=A0A2I0I556_PUNGR|nr:hypothetical protein CRG98_040989 [Punica granatum]
MAESFIVFMYMISLLLHLPTGASPAAPQCHEDERSALLDLKRSLKEGPEHCYFQFLLRGDYRKLESWKLEESQEGRNCCSWSRVQCDERTGHVIGLDLSNACLYGSINSSSSLFRLVHLENLKLTFNNFSFSSIPPEIGNLSRLTVLELAGNVLTGEIPSSFGNLTRLSSLDLSVNQLTGQIPSFLGSIHQLSELDLADNKLTGQIPKWFSIFVYMRFLNLSGNSLTRFPQPSVFPDWKQLLGLDLWSNQLHGPFRVVPLATMQFYFFSENRLSGTISSMICNASNIRVLDPAKNNLSGVIPQCLSNLSSTLTMLSLYDNNFKGGIPEFQSSTCSLRMIDLSSNQLEGSIPRVKQFNTFDSSSYKGNAGLCGEPLSKKCAGPDNVAPPAPAAGDDHEGSNTLFDNFDWKIILMGFARGLVIGVVLGQGINIGGDNLFDEM